MTFTLRDRVVLVTGGSSGLGREIATAAARQGAAVAITWHHSGDLAQETLDHIRATGGRAVAVQADAGEWASAQALVASVERSLGPITVLINNAGTTRAVPAERIDLIGEDDWLRTYRVNVVGAFATIQAVAPSMRAADGGRILNVASDSAFSAAGSSIPYAVSKSALVAMTRALAAALGPDIAVDAIAPTWMATPWLERHLDQTDRAALSSDSLLDPGRVASIALDILADDRTTGRAVEITMPDHHLQDRTEAIPWRP
jgi:3-oxoacyl-[acyl-carrier protein] reductase